MLLASKTIINCIWWTTQWIENAKNICQQYAHACSQTFELPPFAHLLTYLKTFQH